MTKQAMIDTILNRTADAWRELNRYDSENKPTDATFEKDMEWDTNDEGHLYYLAKWSELFDLVAALDLKGQTTEYAEEQEAIAKGYYDDWWNRSHYHTEDIA